MKLKQDSLPLAKALDELVAGEPAYFCTPGHRFENGISDELISRFGRGIFRYDLTETYGLDDLHDPTGAIEEEQRLLRELYKADYSRFLVNGTTCGNEALIMSVCRDNDEIIVARNCHQSVISGMVLSGARPVYVQPEYDETFGIYTEIKAGAIEEGIKKHPDAKAVFITSPTYYGTVSDIRKIADVCHKNNIPLLVDEAHGSHLYFSEHLPKGALSRGADGVVMSFHKTLGSMTQSSVLHISGSLIDIEMVDAALKMLMSSSPSYILMTSLSAARHQLALRGKELTERAVKLAEDLRARIEKINGISLYKGSKELYDITRVVFSANELGLSGYALSDILFDRFGICLEMADMDNAVAIVTYGNSDNDIERLSKALEIISEEREYYQKSDKNAMISNIPQERLFSVMPDILITPREAYFSGKEKISLDDAIGRISAQSIAPYPPGIPVVNPGELISERIYEILRYCRDNNIRVHTYGTNENYDITVVKQ